MNLIEFVRKNNIQTPVQLEIGLDKLKNRLSPDGDQIRYFHVRIGGTDVTSMAAELAGLPVSHAKDTEGSLIIHGCGTDMGFALQARIYRNACAEGYPDMFDDSIYRYLGHRIGKRKKDPDAPAVYRN